MCSWHKQAEFKTNDSRWACDSAKWEEHGAQHPGWAFDEPWVQAACFTKGWMVPLKPVSQVNTGCSKSCLDISNNDKNLLKAHTLPGTMLDAQLMVTRRTSRWPHFIDKEMEAQWSLSPLHTSGFLSDFKPALFAHGIVYNGEQMYTDGRERSGS